MTASTLIERTEDGARLALLAWQFPQPRLVAATAAVGGGLGERSWVINAQVPDGYRRVDHQRYGAELADIAGVRGDGPGAGVVMLTATDVRRVRRSEVDGVLVEATVGLTHPVWAVDPPGTSAPAAAPAPGTINILVAVTVRLSEAAMLNALCTVTEAKTQALLDAGVEGTGTPSDAVTVAATMDGAAEPFGGPRSRWGQPIARAVYAAVLAGARGRPQQGGG